MILKDINMETRNIIGYDFSKGTGQTLQGVNPKTNTSIADEFYIASETDVNNAMAKAQKAFHPFSKMDWAKRASFLEAIAEEMENLGEELVQHTCDETGLPQARILGERGRTVGQLRMFANHIKGGDWVEASIDTAIPDREPIPRVDIRKMMVGLGPVVVFGSSNFPLAYSVAGGDTAAAVAAGCPVVVKAHPAHPGTSALVGQAIAAAAKKTNMPEGVFSLVFDNGFKIGQALVEHSSTTAVGFTGSLAGGRALFDIANKRPNPIPVFAEMGSTNPVVLLPEALKSKSEQIAIDYAGSITLGVGQFCTNPGLLFGIKGKELDSFKDKLSTALTQTNPDTMLHKGIGEAFAQKSSNMLNESAVQLLSQSETASEQGQGRPMVALAKGSDFITNPALHEEVFGPFSMLIECENSEELSACISSLNGQLTGTIMGDSTDFKNHTEAINLMEQKVGRLIFNGVPTGVEVCASMHHGGPFPATTDTRFTAVGIHSIKRFTRPVSYQNTPNELLPKALQNENPLQIMRLLDGKYSTDSI